MTNMENSAGYKKLTFWERNKLSGGYLLQKVIMEKAVSIVRFILLKLGAYRKNGNIVSLFKSCLLKS